MACVVVTNFNKRGSYYYVANDADTASTLYNALSLVENKDIQVVIISKPEAYGEYAPFTRIERIDELFLLAGGMSKGI